MTVYGDGSQTRSFCYIDDLVEGIFRVVGLPSCAVSRPEAADREEPIFNLGSTEEATILQLARDVIDVTGSRSRVVFEPQPVDDPRTRRPDITRARQLLGWEPKVGRLAGLEKAVPYFRSALADCA